MKALGEKDLPKAYKLIKQLREELSLEDFIRRAKLAFQTQHYTLFALENKEEEEEEFIGLCGVMPFNVLYHAHCLYICDFVVEEKSRRCGIGEKFLKEIELWAKNQGYKELELSSSFARVGAHKFYEKMHFDKTSFVFKKRLP